MSTTSRLLNLLSLLQTRRDWPGPVLAERLEVSPRTVRRDIDRLRELGYNIQATTGPEGSYRLDAGTELPPLLFDEAQAVSVALALQTAAAAGVQIEEGAVRALATIRQVVPPRLRPRLDALQITTVERPGDAAPRNMSIEVLVDVATAIRACEVLRFDYCSRGDGSATRRRVEPHHLISSSGHSYLLAWDLDRDDWRLFSIDRVMPRIPTGPRFTLREVPAGDVQQFVSARFRGSDVDVNDWTCKGTVILDLPASEVLPFAGDGKVVAINADQCSLESGSWSWGSLAASFGRFEVTMEVVEPPELAEAFSVLAQRYAAAKISARCTSREARRERRTRQHARPSAQSRLPRDRGRQ